MKKFIVLFLAVAAVTLLTAGCRFTSSKSADHSSDSVGASAQQTADASVSGDHAEVTVGSITNATTSLTPGNYPLDKPINFTVKANVGYEITDVKMGESTLNAVDGSYTFTPTKAGGYALTVATAKKQNAVFMDFKGNLGNGPIERDGVRFAVTGNTDYTVVYKNDKLTLSKGDGFVLNGRTGGETKEVWIRKVAFVFASGKENLNCTIELSENVTYVDGVFSATEFDSSTGENSIFFAATGDVVIDMIIFETEEHRPLFETVTFKGVDAEDKVYYMEGSYDDRAYANKKAYDPEKKFEVGQLYYFLIEAGERHTKYYELAALTDESNRHLSSYFTVPDENHPEKVLVSYCCEVKATDNKTQTLEFVWSGKSAAANFKVDEQSAVRYIKGFMETDPINSCGLPAASLIYGETYKISPTLKKNFIDLEITYNGQPLEAKDYDGSIYYEITVAERAENTISFSATLSEDKAGIFTLELSGDAAGKMKLYGAIIKGVFMFTFKESEDHPTANATKVLFDGEEVPAAQHSEDDDVGDYKLTKEQTAKFNAAATNLEKAALFTVTVAEEASYSSKVTFNSGDFTVAVADKQPDQTAEGAPVTYTVAGRSSVTVTITPKENKAIFAVEVNDVRLTASDYVLNANGSLTYTFVANPKENVFIIQTIPEKVALTATVTAGYKISEMPAEKVECGANLKLKLVGADDEHFLFGKKITVTYNGQEQVVSADETGEFTFVIVPVKSATEIVVTVIEEQVN